MKVQSFSPPKITTGLDVGDRYTTFCTLHRSGEIEEAGRIRTTPEALRGHFEGRERTRVALEVGAHSPWVSRLLKELGHEVLVANARKLRLIYDNDNKGDPVDAESLARVARLDPKLLAPIEHRGKEAQSHLSLIRARDALVRARTALVNHTRGSVKAVGGRLPRCSTSSFPQKVSDHIPEELRLALTPTLETITQLTRQIRAYDKQIEALCQERYPETALLEQVGGVGPVTSLCYVLTLEDPTRFQKSRGVGAYLGLRRKRDDSGESRPALRITKAGDKLLRRLLVGSAHYILGPFGPDTDLRRWGLRLYQRGGGTKKAKKKAAVAVARKLAVLLHHLWITGEVYEPLRNGYEPLRNGSRRKTA